MLPLEALSPDFQRLAKIKDYCEEIDGTLERFGRSFELFQTDRDYQRSVSLSLLQIGELAGGLTEEFRRQSGAQIPWHMVRAMRNIVAHDYDAIRLDSVWQTAAADIPALKAFCEEELRKARME